MGCGEFSCQNERIVQHLDVNTQDYSLSLIVSGALWFKDQQGQVQILKKGDVFQRKPGMVHSTCVVPTEEYREQFCLMSGDLYLHFNQMELIPREMTFQSQATPESTKQFSLLAKAIKNDSPHWYKKAMNAMQNWLFLIDDQKDEKRELTGLNKKIFAKEELVSSWSKPIPFIAQDLGMSYSTFRKWFKQEVGLTPGAFRKLSRVKLGCDLLLQPNLSITHVSEALDYPDVYSFSKQFKQVIGVTPSQFKQNPLCFE
ncbi:hypothetical protein NM09_03115 [Vibrio caribbeanicus]|uniref:HTH araC/xylS-type domain-containing protein n=2 Tax=Vibrio TaxID=662 RepID=A0A0A5JNY0_PHOS4|nr:hypothetical protein NM06_01735 [Vibrio sinaloensis]KHD26386.1 hypothetical protein NM09_03115 [Vibrio caribbeanicus]